jgi:hypothetical protein
MSAFLMGAVVLAEDPDSGSVVVADWHTTMVASLLFNDAPGDFFVVAPTIDTWLEQGGDATPRPKTKATRMREMYRRSIWLSLIVGDPDYFSGDADDVVAATREAAPFTVYSKERSKLAVNPSLAVYWLLSHAIAGRIQALVDAIQRTGTCQCE